MVDEVPIKAGKWTPVNVEVRERFLLKLAQTGSIMRAASGTGASYNGILIHRRKDEDFERQVKLAMLMWNDHLEEKLYERAVDGLKEPIMDKNGKQCKDDKGNLLFRIKVSDRLFEMLIKRHIPEYREKMQVDHVVSGGVLVLGAPVESNAEWQERHGGRVIDIEEKKK